MAVILSIVKSPPGVALSEEQKSFGPEGGIIGRGAGNDWVLSDPERFLSSKHCKVAKEGDRYYLTDLSTNGTFINGSQEAVGRGARVALGDGDTVELGDYRFKVSVERDVDSFPGSPFADQDAFGATEPNVGMGPMDDVPDPTPESMYMSNEYGGAVGDITPDEMKITDPLLALDRADGVLDSSNSQAPRVPNDPPNRGSQEDSADLLHEAAQWPDAKLEQSVLPDDWDDDISILGKRASELKSKPSPNILADDDSLIVNKDLSPEPEPEFAPRPAPQSPAPPPKPVAPKPSVPKPSASKPSARPSAAPRRAPSSANADALLNGLGLSEYDLSAEQLEEIQETVATMLRETIDGLMQVLRSRASIKNEFRMNVTTIQPKENNPIKFSANVDEVLELMFLRRSKAYKGPVDSIQESFNTIADHQVAVIAGIRTAFNSAMRRFDPVFLEEEFKQMGKGSLLSGLSKGKYWTAYQQYYQSVINDMERSFQEMFGDEFVAAYEDQLRKLAMARKKDI